MGGVPVRRRSVDEPQGTTLAVDPGIEDGAWRPYLGANPLLGRCLRIGVLQRGDGVRAPSATLCIVSTMDAQSPRRHGGTSLLAAVALIARWGHP